MQSILNSVRKQITTKFQKKQMTVTVTPEGQMVSLDLSYILPNVIAMSFPGNGLATAYRNDGDQVVAFLDEHHASRFFYSGDSCLPFLPGFMFPDHFLIFNLAEEQYDSEKFHYRVRLFPFPDHHSPPLELLFRVVTAMDKFLEKNNKNVVVVHCLVCGRCVHDL